MYLFHLSTFLCYRRAGHNCSLAVNVLFRTLTPSIDSYADKSKSFIRLQIKLFERHFLHEVETCALSNAAQLSKQNINHAINVFHSLPTVFIWNVDRVLR